MSHIAILYHVTHPDGTVFSQERMPQDDEGRLNRGVKMYLRQQGLALEDVVTAMSVVNKNTGKNVRFTYVFTGAWELEVSIRCFKDSIAPISERYTNLTYQDTRDITGKLTREHLV
jgi:hypothetical protein